MAIQKSVITDEVKQDLIRASSPRPNIPINILLVDDSTTVHRMTAHRFKMLNWNLTSAYNGKEAVEMYRRNGLKDIDLILMDKEMPIMTGETATETLVKMGCKTPIIALTSYNYDDFVASGAMGVLHKPLQLPNLLQTLLLTRKKKEERAQTPEGFLSMIRQLWFSRIRQEPTMVMLNPDIENWTTEEVCRWLTTLGHSYRCFASSFVNHGINGRMLLSLGDPAYYEILAVINPLHRMRINMGIQQLKENLRNRLSYQKVKKTQQQEVGAAHAASCSSAAMDEEPLSEDEEAAGGMLIDSAAPVFDAKVFVNRLSQQYTPDQFNAVLRQVVTTSLPKLTDHTKQFMRNVVTDDLG